MKRFLSFLIFGLLGAVFTAAAVEAQSPQRARALYVSDSTSDNVWRVQDNNCDGDYNDPGEVVEFYNDVIGSVPLSNNVGIAVDPQGRILLCDTTADVIVRLTDMDGDGNANGVGEAKVVFDGNPAANPAGIRLFAANDLEVDAGGAVWIAVADGGGGGIDAIVRLEDLNMNDDFQDLGEALVYYQPANGGGVGDSLPADIKIGQDGKAYYLEVGSTGFWQKGIYRLDDIDGSGVIDNPATEVQPYFLPPLPAGATNQFFWGFQQDAQGAWYVADTLNELVYRVFDANGNNTIDAGESVIWWQNPGSSNPWMIDIGPDGSVYVAEDQTPDRLLRLVDLDFSGTIDQPNEVIEMYSDLVSATDLTRPRSLAIGPGQPVYRGNGADVAMSVAINGMDIDDGSQVHCMNVGDVVTFSMFSPNNTLTNQGFVLLAQVFTTGAAAAPLFLATNDPLPSVYLDLANPIFVLLDGLNPQLFAPILGNWQYTASIPPSLFGTGQSIMLELIARAPGFNNVGLGNASSHELLLP